MNVDRILEVLWIFESAPSAYILARGCTDNPCSDQEARDVYERPEGYNDHGTETVVRSMTPQQLAILVAELLLINNEHRDNDDAEAYEDLVGSTDIESMLS